jgi:flagellar biosynthesis protein FlhG
MRNRPSSSPLQTKQALQCVAIASGKGGVGKTVFAVNLAVALIELGKRVLLVDSDFGLANADIMLGATPSITLQDTLLHGGSLADSLVSTPYGVDLLPSGSGAREVLSLDEAAIESLVGHLMVCASAYDVVLLDCAGGITSQVTGVLASVPQTIIVATPQPTSLIDAYALLKIIQQDRLCGEVGVVLNMARSQKESNRAWNLLNDVNRAHMQLRIDLLGSIPFSERIPEAIQARRPLLSQFPESAPSGALRQIARALLQRRKRTSRLEDLNAEGYLKAFLKGDAAHAD